MGNGSQPTGTSNYLADVEIPEPETLWEDFSHRSSATRDDGNLHHEQTAPTPDDGSGCTKTGLACWVNQSIRDDRQGKRQSGVPEVPS